MSARAQDILLAAFTILVVIAALYFTFIDTHRGPLIDRSERPLPTVPEWTPATASDAVPFEEKP